MGKGRSKQVRDFPKPILASLLALLIFTSMFQGILPSPLPYVHAQGSSPVATVAPSQYWGTFFGSSGDVQINVNRTGIAIRVEIPREFLQGVISTENDTSFIQSDIRNDYYYYSVVDEANHWTYAWRGRPSDGPCFKPHFSLHDPNAPWCVEIWNYLNDPHHRPQAERVTPSGPPLDYCALPNATRYVFSCFSPPKFIRFRNLNSPSVAGLYNFTLFVANRTNSIGYPDFVHAWNTTLFVPVSMSHDAGAITGFICDGFIYSSFGSCPKGISNDKGVVYATNVATGQIGRAYVNQINGRFTLTGLAAGSYMVQGAAGFVNGVAYSLSTPVQVEVYADSYDTPTSRDLFLPRAPQVCGSISYDGSPGNQQRSFSDNPNLLAAFGPGSDQRIKLNITIEATDSHGHVFRSLGLSSNSKTDPFFITTSSNVTYVGTDPYGTEFAGLPPVPLGSTYNLTLHVQVTGYTEEYSNRNVVISTAPGPIPTKCGDPGTNMVSPDVSTVLMGGLITGTIQLVSCKDPGCPLETPNGADQALGLAGSLFGGNILIEAYNQAGVLSGVAVNGTTPTLTGDVSSLQFYVIGFSDYANHTRSGVWNEADYGLPPDHYTLRIFIRGYEQIDSPTFDVPQGGPSNGGSNVVHMARGGTFQVTVASYNNRYGSGCVIQSQQPWRFLNLAIPIRARVYYYDSSGRVVGFNETVMETGVNHGTGRVSFTVLFTGQNWSVREIWFYGYIPTHITDDTYTIRGFTLGYVQCRPVTSPNDLGGFVRTAVPLVIANEIDMTAVQYQLMSTTEHDHAIGDAFSAGLKGALPANMSANVPSLSLKIAGFGAWDNVSCIPAPCRSSFLGQGHFYYVSPDGARYFDYGLDIGNYTAEVPEFGFLSHLTPIPPTNAVGFNDLGLQVGFGVKLFTMDILYVSTCPLIGAIPINSIDSKTLCRTTSVLAPVPLSWVRVTASNASFSRSVPTLDGFYFGIGALFVPPGTYNVSFTVPFYRTQTTNVTLNDWGESQPVPVPDCQDNALSTTCPTQSSPAPPSPHSYQFTASGLPPPELIARDSDLKCLSGIRPQWRFALTSSLG